MPKVLFRIQQTIKYFNKRYVTLFSMTEIENMKNLFNKV